MKFPTTKEEFEEYKAALEARGFTVTSKWRKGLKNVNLGDIVLSGSPASALIGDTDV